jgi:hypothetical protein
MRATGNGAVNTPRQQYSCVFHGVRAEALWKDAEDKEVEVVEAE